MKCFQTLLLLLLLTNSLPSIQAQVEPDSLVYVQLLDYNNKWVDSFSTSLLVKGKSHPLAFQRKQNFYHVFLIPKSLRTNNTTTATIVVEAAGYLPDTLILNHSLRAMAYFFQLGQPSIELNGGMPYIPLPNQYVIMTHKEDNQELFQLLEKYQLTIQDTLVLCTFHNDFYYCQILVEDKNSLVTDSLIQEFIGAGYFMGMAFMNHYLHIRKIQGLQPVLHLGVEVTLTELEHIKELLKKKGFPPLSQYYISGGYKKSNWLLTIPLPKSIQGPQLLPIVNQKLQNLPYLNSIQPEFIEGPCPG